MEARIEFETDEWCHILHFETRAFVSSLVVFALRRFFRPCPNAFGWLVRACCSLIIGISPL